MLVAHRMADIYEDISRRMAAIGVLTRLETRAAAALACAEHGTDVDGMNHKDVVRDDM